MSKPTPNPKILLRNERIRERYNHLSNVKFLKDEKIFEMLEDEFLPLSKETLWCIVSQTGYYKNL